MEQCVIAADHYHSLFVWSGQETRGASYDAVRRQFKDLLPEQSKDRFPMLTFHLVSEGDSMSRRFTSLLSPSHADPPQHQVAHFSALEHLTEEELSHLRSKFRFHDPSVDPSFRQWFWDVASASSVQFSVLLLVPPTQFFFLIFRAISVDSIGTTWLDPGAIAVPISRPMRLAVLLGRHDL